MSVPSTSHFHFNGSIVKGPIRGFPPIPNSGNVFPKYPYAINETAWELWYFDGISKPDEAAIVIDFSRQAGSQHLGGSKVQILGIWRNGRTWHRDIYFPESFIETAEDTGAVAGVWRDSPNGSEISFHVDADCSHAEIEVLVPGIVTGSMSLTSLPGDTGLDTSTELGPLVHYMRPIGRASINAKLTFKDSQSVEPDAVSTLHLHDEFSAGGMDRVWSLLSWPQIMTESYYLRAHVGPYTMQVMCIIPSAIHKSRPWTVARLYREGQLICAAQNVVDAADEDQRRLNVDSLGVSKIYGDASDTCLTGLFRDSNIGYNVDFIQGGEPKKKWRFRIRHVRTFWNIPTSAPGPNGTGNTGFVEHIRGGLNAEDYQGVGLGGQCELS
ncbi:hypothetical protein ANO14919_104040 [Xylariales sp. No.14919]|nr:hypothetical protein ANO14919_104040 [Xylariales sp. No.14919]